MYKTCENLLTQEDFLAAYEVVSRSDLMVRRTPCILAKHQNLSNNLFNNLEKFTQHRCGKVYLKCENMQNTGSFKIRGLANQLDAAKKYFEKMEKEVKNLSLVTMSAGNYGRTFAYAAKYMGFKGTVLMPDSAPNNRSELIRSFGLNVERLPSRKLMEGVKKHEANSSVFLHPFDDIALIAGHGTLGMEILEDVPDVDVVVVCCGGGGLLAGVASAVKQVKPGCKVFGVEPETASSMHNSLKEERAVMMPGAKSIAAGLAPPFAGENAFLHVKHFCDGIVLVTEDEIVDAVKTAYGHGLVVEPSGAAALAAFVNGKLDKLEKFNGDENVVIVLTGGNVSPQEMVQICS